MKTAKPPGGPPSERRVTLCRGKLTAWFLKHRRTFPWREPSASLYLLLVVEVLLQRTRAETISAFLPGFLDRYPNWEAIAASNIGDLTETLKPIGLWRRRAPPLQGLANRLVALDGQWPRKRDELEDMPAVGQYVANAVLLFVHNEPHPLMDSSMARLLRRYFVIHPEKADIRYDKALHAVAYRVLAKGSAIELNWAILDLAARYCKPRQPECPDCPLKRSCMYGRSVVRP